MLEIGMLLRGRYRILSHIGKGGMGTVFLAKDENLGITVAVKQNSFDEQRLIEAFKREARLLAGLRHSALPQVKDYFIEGAGQYLVMEYIAGDDLGAVLQKHKKGIPSADDTKPFDVHDVVRWAEQLLDALDYLHTRSEPIIHRDIKPQNLKLAERNQIILLDFGLAKGKPLWMTRVTTTGSLYGYTPNYAPIEQIRGLGTDPRSDLYALGATLYHLLTGVPPIDSATRADAFLGREPDPLLPPNHLNTTVPYGITAALMKAMEPHRNNRFSSAAEMLEALRDAKGSTVVDWHARKEEQAFTAGEVRQGENAWPTTEVVIREPPEQEQRIAEEAKQAQEEEERRAREDAERISEREEAARREQAERKQHEEEERKALEEAERLRLERERELKAQQEAEQMQKQEVERKQREEQERLQREEAKRLKLERERNLKAQQEAERQREEERERNAREQAEEKRREEKEQKEREEAERLRLQRAQELQAQREAERKQKEEEDRKAKEMAERQRREEEECRAQEQAESLRLEQEMAEREAREAERVVKPYWAPMQPEEAEQRARDETDRKQREEEERAARVWAEEHLRQGDETRAREEEERLGLEEERKVRAQAEQLRKRVERERKAREDAAQKKLQEEQQRKAREEAKRLAQQQEETRRQLAREDAERWSEAQREQPKTRDMPPAKPQARTVYLIGGVGALLLLIISIWFAVSTSKEDKGSKPSSGPAVRGPQSSQPGAGVAADALEPGSFAVPSRVVKVALSDDGSVLASAGDETSVRLWQASGTRELIGHAQNATSVAVSHDGQIVASGCKDGTIRLWRVSDGQVIKSWRAHWDNIFSVSFSKDGRTLFSAGWDSNVRLWRVPDGVLIKTVSVPEKDYLIVTVNPDSRSLGVYRNDGLNNDGSFRVWSLADNHLIKPLDGWIPSVNCGVFSRDGLLLALGTRAGVEVWRVNEGRQMREAAGTGVASVAFSSDEQTLAAGLQNGAIKLFSVRGELIKTFEGHRGSVNGLSFSADGRLLASGSDDKTVRVWDVAEK